jgi:hypothetical protein
VQCSIAEASVEEIDRLNILQATMLAMRRAVEGLRLRPVMVLVDGNRLPGSTCRPRPSSKAMRWCSAISAASILAKVHRDRWCRQVHEQYPQYGFAGTRATAPPPTWRRCRPMGASHHCITVAPLPRWPRCWLRAAPESTGMTSSAAGTLILAQTTRWSKTCAGWRRTPRPTASWAGSGWRVTTSAAPRQRRAPGHAAVFSESYWPQWQHEKALQLSKS